MRVIRTVLVLLLTFSLFGCSSNDIQISKEDALEVALDNEGLSEEDITDPVIKKEEDCYEITFNTNEGSYVCYVNQNGFYRGKKYTANETETKEEKKKEESTTNIATKPTQEQKKVDIPEDMSYQIYSNAYGMALQQLGVYDSYVQSVKIREEGSNYKVSIKLTNGDGITYVVLVDSTKFNVVNWYQE